MTAAHALAPENKFCNTEASITFSLSLGVAMPEKSTVSEAVSSGDRRTALVALRDALAADIDNPETLPRDRAAIVKQLQSVLSQIEDITAPESETVTPLETARRRRETRTA
ncbi:hypothetical protein M3B80_008335 [Micrococcus luteus]|nr:hypothetical protein [Micrococcus luteus]